MANNKHKFKLKSQILRVLKRQAFVDKRGVVLAGLAGIFIAILINLSRTAPVVNLIVDEGGFHQFGSQKVDQLLQHSFRIENPNSFPVIVKRMITSCACLVVGNKDELVDYVIQPGEILDVSIALSTENRVKRVGGTVGLLVKYLEKGVASPEFGREETVRLDVEAYVPPDVTTLPENVDLGRIVSERVSVDAAWQVLVSARDGVAWELGKVSDQILQVTEEPVTRALSIRVDPEVAKFREPGSYKSFVELIIRGSGQDKLFIPVRMDIVNVLEIVPAFLAFKGPEIEKVVKLTGGKSFQIKSILVNQIPIAMDDVSFRAHHQVKIKLSSADPQKGEVVFMVGLQSGEVIVKSIEYFVLEKKNE